MDDEPGRALCGVELDGRRTTATALDAADPLSDFVDRFEVPAACYLDGNSLGPIADRSRETLERAIDQWRSMGVEGWTGAEPPWFWYGEHLGDRLAPLVGAREEEVVVANSTTVNIHTLIGSFLDDRPEGAPPGVLVNELDFPTDHYAIASQLRQRGHDPARHLHRVESRDGRTIETVDIIDAMDDHDVSIVFMPSVLYRSGQRFDIEAITEAAHDRGLIVGFDIAHSIGVVPHRFDELGVDFAVWCSYKYLNGGPGAIGGLYVHRRHHDMAPALAGWWGHHKPTQFDFNPTFTPATDAGAWQIGTVPVLSAAPLFGALDLVHEAGIARIREKSTALTTYLIHLIDERLAPVGFAVGTPRAAAERGGHVALEHDEAAQLNPALRAQGVVADFRPPNVIRLAPSPLYTRFVDLWEAVATIRRVLETGDHLDRRDDDGDPMVT